MVGKGALIVILGFSLVFGVGNKYWNRTSNEAIENFVNYYDSTAAHVLAVSAVNILADSLFWNQGSADLSNADFAPQDFHDGTFYMYTRPDTVDGEYDVLATAVAKYTGFRGHVIYDSVQMLMEPGRFNQWAYFTDRDSDIYWTTGEVLDGRYHTNGTLYLKGAPVFKDNISTGVGLTTYWKAPQLISPSDLPDKKGNKLIAPGYTSGVIIPMPNTLANYESISNVYMIQDSANNGSKYAYDVYVTLNGTTVSYYTVTSSVSISGSKATYTEVSRVPAGGTIDVPVGNLGDAGGKGLGSVVLVKNGDLHISGQIDGKVTFVAEEGSGSSARVSSGSYGKIEGNKVDVDMTFANGKNNHDAGNIIINGDITYANMPTDVSDSRNLLGLVADNSIAVSRQTNTLVDLTIDGSLFCRQGSFFNSMYTTGDRGTLTLFGSMAQKTRGPVGLVKGYGYEKNYAYDHRFERTSTSPPMSPSTGKYNIASWRE